jgi:endonuclease/exonuclease/phosphatase (EEP) superfamily protein YafD
MTEPKTEPPRLSIRHTLLNTLVALSGAYGLSVTGFLALRWLIGEQWSLVALFNSFAHLLFVPALPLILICMLLRRFRVIVLLIAPLLAFLISYGFFFTSRPSRAAPNALRINILTFNLKSQIENFDSMDGVIREADADVVALQELSEVAASHLDSEFAASYPYRALHPQPGEPIPGQGILSRFPIESNDFWRIYFGQQRVTLNAEGQTFTLYNVHTFFPFTVNGFARRTEEITDILRRAENDSGPIIIAGDFNLTDQEDDYWRVAAQYTDTYREIGQGMGFTFPNYRGVNPRLSFLPPLARIDYIFHNELVDGVEVRVWPSSGGSDHRPLYAVLALRTRE